MEQLLQNDSFIFWGALVLMTTVPSAVLCWQRVRRAEIDAELKRHMIERGMSADEIEPVARPIRTGGMTALSPVAARTAGRV